MFGPFQQSQLRIEVPASADRIARVLLQTDCLRQWLFPQVLVGELPLELFPGLRFTSWAGPIPVDHLVEAVDVNRVCFLLSRAVDGVHEWHWGEGWVQSRLEGVSLIPLDVGHRLTLIRLKTYLTLSGPCN
ncbi:MAG: hypothetical protein WCD18_27110 [Thermosynechococcaceae cyanobacterium]